jgi:site-specific recombinase XerD
MPSVRLDLGKYVTLRPRKDGTHRVLLEVPARLRPSGWSAAIPLPVKGTRTGDLTNLEEVARIKADADSLYARLVNARLGREEAPKVLRDLPHLVREWEASQFYKAKKPRTQQGYSYHAGLVLDWSEAAGNKPVAALEREAIESFLTLYDDRPTTRRHVKIVLKMLLDHAVALKWRTDNPAERIKVAAPKSKVRIWEREDVMAGAWACVMAGQAPLAALMLTEWEIGQRLTDTRMFRWGGEYKPEERAFKFWQEKTGNWVTIPVSDALAGLLEAIHLPDSLFLFADRKTGKPFAEQRLGHVWQAIRTEAGFNAKLQVRALRHSCVVQLARAGCDVPEIASITGHSPFSANQILAKYLPRDNEVAWNAQRKRGLIGAKVEQKSDGQSDEQSDGRLQKPLSA